MGHRLFLKYLSVTICLTSFANNTPLTHTAVFFFYCPWTPELIKTLRRLERHLIIMCYILNCKSFKGLLNGYIFFFKVKKKIWVNVKFPFTCYRQFWGVRGSDFFAGSQTIFRRSFLWSLHAYWEDHLWETKMDLKPKFFSSGKC